MPKGFLIAEYIAFAIAVLALIGTMFVYGHDAFSPNLIFIIAVISVSGALVGAAIHHARVSAEKAFLKRKK